MLNYAFFVLLLLVAAVAAQRGRSLSEDSIPDSCRRRLQSNFFQTGGQSSYGCVLHEPLENSRTRATDFCMTCRFPYFYTNDQVKDQIRTSAVDALRLERNRFNTNSGLTFVVNGTDDVYDFMSIFARDARNRDIYNALDNVYYFFRNGSVGLASYNDGRQQGDLQCDDCRVVAGRDMLDLPRACRNAEDRRSGDGLCVLHQPDRSSNRGGAPGDEYCIKCQFKPHTSDRDANAAIESLASGLNNRLNPDDRLYMVFDPAHKKYDLRESLKNQRNVLFKVNQAYYMFPNGSVSVLSWHGAGAIPDSERRSGSGGGGGSIGNRDDRDRNRDNDLAGRNRVSSFIQPTRTNTNYNDNNRYDYADRNPATAYNVNNAYNSNNNNQRDRVYGRDDDDALDDVVIRPTFTRDTFYSYTPYPDTFTPTIGLYTQTRFGEQVPSNRLNQDDVRFSTNSNNASPRDQQPPSCSAKAMEISNNGLCFLHQPMTGDAPASSSLLSRQQQSYNNDRKKFFCITCRPRRDSRQADLEEALNELTRVLARNQEFITASSNDNGKVVVVINAAQEYFTLRDIVRHHPQLEYALDRAIFLFQNGSSAITRYSTGSRVESGSYGPGTQYTATYSRDRQEETFTMPIRDQMTQVQQNTRYNNNNNYGGSGNNDNNNVVISTITANRYWSNSRDSTRTITVTTAPGDGRPTAYVPQFDSMSNEEQQTVCFVVRKGQQSGRAGGIYDNNNRNNNY